MNEIIWIRSQAGTLMPSVNHYIFLTNRRTNTEKIYWRCSNKSCSVRLISNKNFVFFCVEKNNMHTSDAADILNLELKEMFKNTSCLVLLTSLAMKYSILLFGS
ncbi:hypothetical protein DMUE_5352 [Dictyocoela muelleri]|nr:hypothetical protein DMUE_5352 [Dictyocoela muelleri]